MLASVVVNNHNYGRFLAEAVESALEQTHPQTEVVVVDDGSTDDSRAVLERFRDDVEVVLKENGGQRSAFNAGLARSRGELVCFLDADDALDPTAIERAVELAAEPGVSKVQWPLRGVTADGSETGDLFPPVRLDDGSLRERVLRDGPDCSPAPPTSGNAWSRGFLERVMPMPEVAANHRNHADAYLFALALLFGEVRAIQEPLGSYRLHGDNIYATLGFREQLERNLSLYAYRCEVLAEYCRELGIDADASRWDPEGSWVNRLTRSLEEIERLVPAGEPFLFLDETQWALPQTGDCVPVPFPSRDGVYWGLPTDDEAAISELEAARADGVRFLVFAWQTFWWLDHYRDFARHVAESYRCVLDNDRLKLWVERDRAAPYALSEGALADDAR